MQITRQGIELFLPELPVVRDPLGGTFHRFGYQVTPPHAAGLGAFEQPGRLEHAQVLRDAGQGNIKPRGEPGDGGVAQRELRQDGAPRGSGERGEGGVQGGPRILNHTV